MVIKRKICRLALKVKIKRPLKKKGPLTSLNFVSDALNRKINQIINKYDFDIQLVSRPANNIIQSVKPVKKKTEKHPNCDLCERLPERHKCSDRHLVYKFTCDICEAFYIGQTSRMFSLRFKEHMRSLDKKDKISALSQHVLEVHNNLQGQVSFKIDIIKQCFTPLETRLTESQFIDRLRPTLNRQHERTW